MAIAHRTSRLAAVVALAALVGILLLTSAARAELGYRYNSDGSVSSPVNPLGWGTPAKVIVGAGVVALSVSFYYWFILCEFEPVPDGDANASDGVGVKLQVGRPDQPLPPGTLVEQPAERPPVVEGLGGFGVAGPADGGGAPGATASPEAASPGAVGGKPDVVAPLPIGDGVEPGVGGPADGGAAPQAGAPFGPADPQGAGPEAKPGKAPVGTLVPQVQGGVADGNDGRVRDEVALPTPTGQAPVAPQSQSLN